MEKYKYLKRQKNNNIPCNSFKKVDMSEIKEGEKRLGFDFSKSLKEFWLEVGYGFLNTSIDNVSALSHVNRINHPEQIADITILKEDSDYILPEVVEYFDEGYIGEKDIIFFEIGDMIDFLVMKPYSAKPDAVYDMIGNIMEESFERFIWRLYHESPTFYLNVKTDKT